MSYVVTAPLIQARKADGTFVHIYEGGLLPDDQDPAQLEQLLAGAMVAETGDTSGPPSGNASADEWRAYALAHGHTDEELADLSRNDIRALFD